VARGELNLERLGQPSREPPSLLYGHRGFRQAQHREVPDTSTSTPSNRIPLQATPLIGRDNELAVMERIFNDPQCRLLTLTGVGGIGKTRLAIEFALRNLAVFPGGVYFIPLTPVSSPEKIIPAIADVLDFGFSGPNDPKEQLFN